MYVHHLESISQYLATPFGNLDQPLNSESLWKLPLRFRSINDGRSEVVVAAKYEKGIEAGTNSTLPVVFTAIFSVRTSCVEVSSISHRIIV